MLSLSVKISGIVLTGDVDRSRFCVFACRFYQPLDSIFSFLRIGNTQLLPLLFDFAYSGEKVSLWRYSGSVQIQRVIENLNQPVELRIDQ